METKDTHVHVNTVAERSNGMATAALVIGVIGLILAFIPIIGMISWILSPLAIIFGAVGLNAVNKTGVGKGGAITGIVTGIIGLLICLLWATAFGAAVAGADDDIAAILELETPMFS